MYYDWGWRPYVSAAERRRQALREMTAAKEEGTSRLAGDCRRPHHRQDLLGQGVVREPRTLQRLRQPVAARADLRAQRFGNRSSDCAPAKSKRWSAVRRFTKVAVKVAPVTEGALAVHLQGLRGRD